MKLACLHVFNNFATCFRATLRTAFVNGKIVGFMAGLPSFSFCGTLTFVFFSFLRTFKSTFLLTPYLHFGFVL